jgi:hypothetical protein
MNRLVPDRPALARARRHIGALPHGLPTALLFTAAVAALMLGSFVVVDEALPALIGRDTAQARDGFDRSTAMSPPSAPWAEGPAATASASPSTASPRPDPTTSPTIGAPSSTRATAGQASPGRSSGRTVSFRLVAESPSPTLRTGGDASDPGTPAQSPSPSPSPRAADDDGQGWTTQPTVTPTPNHRPSPTPTATRTPTDRPSSTPTATASPREPATPTPEPDD